MKKENVGEPFGTPKTRVEAAWQQHPGIEDNINKLCKLVAKFDLSEKDEDTLTIEIMKRMKAAREQQRARGSKASWHHVDFRDHDAML